MLSDFIRIVTTGNYEPLTLDEWETVLSDFLTRSGNMQSKKQLAYQKQIASLEIHLIQTHSLIMLLSEYYTPEIADRLRKKGYRLPLTETTYIQDLQSILNQRKIKEIQLIQVRAEMGEASTGDNTPPEEQDYYNQLAVMSTYYHYAIDPMQTTVAQYCALLVTFTKANKPN